MIFVIFLVLAVVVGLVYFGVWQLLNRRSRQLRRLPLDAQWERLDREFSISGDTPLVIPRATTFSRAQIKSLGSQHGFEYSHLTGGRYEPLGLAFKRVAPDPIPNRYPAPPKVVAVKMPFGRWRPMSAEKSLDGTER